MRDELAVTLSIRMYHGYRYQDQVNLIREVPMGHLPGIGEQVAILDEDDFLLPVTRRHWTFSGHTVVYLNDIIVNPPANMRICAEETTWIPDPEDESDVPVNRLLSCGWHRT